MLFELVESELNTIRIFALCFYEAEGSFKHE